MGGFCAATVSAPHLQSQTRARGEARELIPLSRSASPPAPLPDSQAARRAREAQCVRLRLPPCAPHLFSHTMRRGLVQFPPSSRRLQPHLHSAPPATFPDVATLPRGPPPTLLPAPPNWATNLETAPSPPTLPARGGVSLWRFRSRRVCGEVHLTHCASNASFTRRMMRRRRWEGAKRRQQTGVGEGGQCGSNGYSWKTAPRRSFEKCSFEKRAAQPRLARARAALRPPFKSFQSRGTGGGGF
mmetsp:Transcript_13079/g.30783  ORF Transcript_13079/g.30783 Transcript_13079/m.30783 type:complete len:243 (+) Transcript_13079:966-1694(+)